MSVLNTCPTDSQLQSFDEGRLSDANIESFANHLSECEKCSERLAQMAPGAMVEGFRKAFSGESSSSEILEFESHSKKMIGQQVDGIMDSIRMDQAQMSGQPALGLELFQIGDLVRENSFCEIHIAHDTILGNRFLIHRPLTELVSSFNHCSQFLSDAKRASTLLHDQIISVAQFGLWDDVRPFFAVDWHEIPTLRQFIQHQQPLNLKTLVQIIVQVCVALRAAHQMRVGHRHLSPDSIHVSPNLSVRVAEFGLTYDGFYHFGLVQPMANPSEFHSPEVRGNDASRIDLRTDIWSFGVLLRWLVERTEFENQSIAVQLIELAKKCQRKSRRKRLQTMVEVQESLIEILKDHIQI